MKLLKKFKVIKEATVIYDTYKSGSYTRNKAVKVPEGTIIRGEKIQKGEKEFITFNGKGLGVDEEIQIASENCKRQYPWGVIITVVVVICGIVFCFVKKK